MLCTTLWFLQILFLHCPRGSLSLSLSLMDEAATMHATGEVEDVYQAILESARATVDATPAIALSPLFECALSAGNHILANDGRKQPPHMKSSLY